MRRFKPGLNLRGVQVLQDEDGVVAIQPADTSTPPRRLQSHQQNELAELLQRFQKPESRRSFRIPLAQLPAVLPELQVVLHVGGKAFPTIPIDLSLNGVRVALFERFVQAEPLHIHLSFEGVDVYLTGRVARRSAHELALDFEFVNDVEPDVLARLHRDLERYWLRNRPGKMTTAALRDR